MSGYCDDCGNTMCLCEAVQQPLPVARRQERIQIAAAVASNTQDVPWASYEAMAKWVVATADAILEEIDK